MDKKNFDLTNNKAFTFDRILDLHFPTLCFKKLLSPPVVPQDLDRSPVGMCNITMDDFSEVMPVCHYFYILC